MPDWVPRDADDLIVRAAVRADADGHRAWERYQANGTATPEPEHERLLPLVAYRRAADSEPDPLLERGQALRRFTRARAHWITHRAAPVVAALTTDAGPPLVLKGLPLALAHYPDPGLRPLHDLDVMVRPSDFPAALSALCQRGYSLPVALDAAFVVDARGMDARAPAGGLDVDVHWQLHRALALPGASAHWGPSFFAASIADDPVWARSVPFGIGGIAARAPSAADLLVHVIVHAATSPGPRTLRWSADAAMLVGGGAVDWDIVTAEAAQRRVTVEIAVGLRYLVDALGVAVPPAALDRLAATPVGSRESVAHAVRSGTPVHGRRVRRHVARWVALTVAERWTAALAAAPRYVRSLMHRTRRSS